MKEMLKLKNPIEINGKAVQDLTYDIELITPEMFAQANALKMKACGATNISGATAELDFTFHLYLGCAAIIACNPEIDYTDLLRVTGRDVNAIMQVGRSFFFDAGDSPESSSDEP